MKYSLQGTTMQMLNLELEQDETVISETGRMVCMSDNVEMSTDAKGGVWSSLKRKFAGESFFLVSFSPAAGAGIVSFGSEFPGKIVPMRLEQGEEIIAQKDAFLCSEASVTFDATWTKKIGAGLLGGEGLVLIKVKGPGLCFFNVGGEIGEYNLAPDQKLRIDTGNLAMFDADMKYDVERVKGIKNIIWGGEGLFLATCTGPGRVWVQSMPVNELAGKLLEYMPSGGGGRAGSSVGGFIAGAALSSMMKR